MQGEMRRMRKETHNLQLSLQRYTGDIDLTAVHYEDLVELEGQLENSVNKVRARKVYIRIYYISIFCFPFFFD